MGDLNRKAGVDGNLAFPVRHDRFGVDGDAAQAQPGDQPLRYDARRGQLMSRSAR
jgi:hypothetical protein